MPSVSFEYEWAGLTLQVEADIDPGEAASLGGLPENNHPGSADEVTDLRVTVGNEDFDVGSITYAVDVSHTYKVNDRGEICWKHSGEPVSPFTSRRLKKAMSSRKRPVFQTVDGKFQKTGEEYFVPVYENRDLEADLVEAALERFADE